MNAQIKYFYLASRILCSPLEALYTILIFILSKDLDVSLWHLTLMACLKPIVSLLSFYISSRAGRVRGYLLALNAAACVPCLFFPWAGSPLFFIASYALFMTAQRAAFPVWGELLKRGVGLPLMSGLVSKGTMINYASIMALPVLFSFWMDQSPGLWKWLFFGLAALQLMNTVLIAFLPDDFKREASFTGIKSPWGLWRENRAFGRYLLLFFLGGAGIIAMQPLLPAYFSETLGLSYAQLTLAFSFCKGISFLCTSPYWAKLMKSISIFRLNAYMNLLTCVFIISVLASTWHVNWLFFGYLMYGAMQAGCELSWNLSGPIFSKERESTFYSGLNLGLVGIRGCICPLMGQLIFAFTSAQGLFLVCLGLCFSALLYALWLDRRYIEICEIDSRRHSSSSSSPI